MSGRSSYEYMGNNRARSAERADSASGQLSLPTVPLAVLPFDLDERYTTRETLAWCAKKAGVDAFDLDVAACAEAHCAERYYTIADDGLWQEWDEPRVWCNPPFSDIGPWVKHAWSSVMRRECEVVAMLLPATRTEQDFWQDEVEPFRDRNGDREGATLRSHFLPGRTRFGIPGNPLGIGVGSPPFGCVLLVFRRSA